MENRQMDKISNTSKVDQGNEINHVDSQMDTKIKEIMMTKIPESEILNQKMEEAYQKVRAMQPGKRKLPMAVKCSTAAAILLLAMVYCVKNPTFAAQLPFIGSIFSGLEDKVSFTGDYSDHSITLPTEADNKKQKADTKPDAAAGIAADSKSDVPDTGSGVEGKKAGEAGTKGEEAAGSKADGKEDSGPGATADTKSDANSDDGALYQVESGGITVTIPEVSFDSNGMYLALLVKNKEGFAKNPLRKDQLGFRAWVKMYREDGSVEDFNDIDGTYLSFEAEGEYVDPYTFQGIAQFSSRDLDLTKYTSCELAFSEFQQRLTTGKTMTATLPDTNEEVSWVDKELVQYKGDWKFRMDIDVQEDSKQEIVLNDANSQGYGIEKVIKTKYEMYAVPILPEGEHAYDYMITFWDADGKVLESHGHDFTKMGITGRDISTVTVYLLKWEDFEQSKGKNWRLQPEKAVYQTRISFKDE